jgi:Na+-translocating ferredoxin:NAD+ oxidoreductase RNF subunit RnfB
MISNAILIVVVGIFMGFLFLWLIGERWRPIRLSTLRYMREAGLRENLNLNSLHAYIYARWIKQYLIVFLNYMMPRLSPNARKWWTDRYHGKVITLDQASAILKIDKEIPLTDLEQIIPYPTARNLVLSGPPDVAVFECGCRGAVENPCEPIQVCMVIGQPFVDFVVDHHPKTSRRLTQQEAIALLKEEHERGHFHSAWFKDVMLNRFYAICNCCGCCCGGAKIMMKYGAPSMEPSGYVAKIDEGLCQICESCVEACPFNAVQMNGNASVIWESCMGCGVCVGQCPNDAISLVRDQKKGMPFDIKLLSDQKIAKAS